MIVSGVVKISIFKEYQLEDVAQAHLDLEERITSGNSVLLGLK
jgi:NADPH:quinone reductase-like Zn-dependent oxidoreductase